MFKHHLKDLTLFEIKLKSPHKDLILVKGNEFESDQIPFEGSVKLSIPEDMHVKRIKLKLVGELNVEFFERDANRVIVDQIYDRLCLLKVDWNNLLTSPSGEIIHGNYGDTFITFNKLESRSKKSATTGSKPTSKPTSKPNSKPSSRSGSIISLDNMSKSRATGSPSRSPSHSHSGSASQLDVSDLSQGLPFPAAAQAVPTVMEESSSQDSSSSHPLAYSPHNQSQHLQPSSHHEHSTTRPSFLRTKSQPSLKEQKPRSSSHSKEPSLIKLPKSGIDGTPFKDLSSSSHHSFLLPKGNYNLPFKAYLPANTSETVEGLNTGKVLYRIECIIERGRFEKVFHKAKHVRIVRTLHPQNLNLVDSIDINNTWPGKVQYTVNLPKKGIALGSTVPVHLLIVPIAKGLKLKAISGVLVQHYHVKHSTGRSPEFEELFGKQSLPIGDPDSYPLDQWSIKSHFKVPEHLKSITQTCDLKNDIVQVKHRLRISIQLKNKEGHVSELRANLPVYVYISANVGHAIGRHYDVDHHYGTFLPVNDKEDILFKKDRDRERGRDRETGSHGTSSRAQSPRLSATGDDATGDSTTVTNADADTEAEEEDDGSLDQDDAPPLYQSHVFDRIYDSSLPQTPLEQWRSQSVANSPLQSATASLANVASYFDFPQSIDNNLQASSDPHNINVSLNDAASSPGSATNSLPNSTPGSASHSTTDLTATGFNHNSVHDHNSFQSLMAVANGPQKSRNKPLSKQPSGNLSSSLDVDMLSKLPSYDQALDDDDDEGTEDLAPSYDNEVLSTSSSPSSSSQSQQQQRNSIAVGAMSIPSQKGKTTHDRNKNHLHLSLPKAPMFGRHSPKSPSLLSPGGGGHGFGKHGSRAVSGASGSSDHPSSTDLASGKPSTSHKIHGVPKILYKKK